MGSLLASSSSTTETESKNVSPTRQKTGTISATADSRMNSNNNPSAEGEEPLWKPIPTDLPKLKLEVFKKLINNKYGLNLGK